MQIINDWPTYLASAGSRYTVTWYRNEGAGDPNFSNLSIVREYLDSRPSLDVAGVRKSGSKIVVDLIVLREGAFGQIVGSNINDGSRYYRIESVVRTDSGSGLRELTAPLFRFADWVTDPFDRLAEQGSRAAVETTKTVTAFTLPVAVLAVGAFLVLRR